MRRVASLALILTGLPPAGYALGEVVPVRHAEGMVHGFLALRTLGGETIADGDLIQTSRGDRVTSRLVFRFRDGSLHDETAVFTQSGNFRLVSDHLIQKGPSFPRSFDVTIDRASGRVDVRSRKRRGPRRFSRSGSTFRRTFRMVWPSSSSRTLRLRRDAGSFRWWRPRSAAPGQARRRVRGRGSPLNRRLPAQGDALHRQDRDRRDRRRRGASHREAAARFACLDSRRRGSGLRPLGGSSRDGRAGVANRARQPGLAVGALPRPAVSRRARACRACRRSGGGRRRRLGRQTPGGDP